MAERPPVDGIDADLLDRHLAGECSEDEAAAVRRWLMVHPEAARRLQRFVDSLDGAADRPAVPDAAASLATLRRRMRDDAAPHTTPPRAAAAAVPERGRRHSLAMGRLQSRSRQWPTVAAAGVIAVCMGLGARWYVAAHPTVAPTPPAPPPQIYETSNRERAELRLPDGTRVRIAPASRLRVAADFGAERRDVYLEGEAYFDVVHDERRPFTVFAGNASARDLGTQFGVRGYADDRAVQVVVRKGAVVLSGVGRLAPGDLGRLSADGRATLRHGVAVDSELAWLDGRLVFSDTPLAEVVRALRRWHDADVQLADSTLGSLPFTGVLTDASLRSSLDLVTATLGLRARRKGSQITLVAIAGRTPRTRAMSRAP